MSDSSESVFDNGTTMRERIIRLLAFALLLLAADVLAQDQPIKVKGGHQLGETAEQFFAEGYEKEIANRYVHV